MGIFYFFKSVAVCDDRDSEITGCLLAQQYDLPFTLLQEDGQYENCLVVAADSSLLPYEAFSSIYDNQATFALNHNWLAPSPGTPDIIGFMTQSYSFPWGEGYRVSETNEGGLETLPADERSPEIIATDIFECALTADATYPHLDFYLARKDYLKGIGARTNNNRYNFTIESPVPGSFFA